MVSGMRCYLAAAGVDVAHEVAKSSLILSSAHNHLIAQRFDADRMIQKIEDAVDQALSYDYKGLWATGDMSWEMGPLADFSGLFEYEWRLEELFHIKPGLFGICQYHHDTLPVEAMREGVRMHRSIFLNDTLSRINPHHTRTKSFREALANSAELDEAVALLCRLHDANYATTSASP
jgi:MEDS: MEthanogen/methylotroph, DcmR Sensory domain